MTSERLKAGDALAVFLGGVLGTLARVAVMPHGTGIGGVTVVNLVGAWALGWVSATLTGRARLFLGTGFLGAFTTYGAMALMGARYWTWGLLWSLVLVVTGVLAARNGRRVALITRRWA